jgi:hypothetical protein
MYELNLNDLRRLGHFDHTTAKLVDGTIAEMRFDGLYITYKNAMIGGKKSEIKMREDYAHAYSKIKTIKHDKTLIAERRQGKLVTTDQLPKSLKA